MKSDPIRLIREDYDNLAQEYARHIADELQHKPFDRKLLDRFAEEMRGRGDVCDMGCGPGHVARYLHDAKVNVFGLDLSPGMLQEARKLNPAIPFREGNILGLDLPDGVLAGITAFYAIVNLPQDCLLTAFREMLRVLKARGLLLLAFHVGDEVLHEDELWGVKVSMEFCLLKPAEILSDLEKAGFEIEEILEREPYPDVEYPSRRAYIFARKRVAA